MQSQNSNTNKLRVLMQASPTLSTSPLILKAPHKYAAS